MQRAGRRTGLIAGLSAVIAAAVWFLAPLPGDGRVRLGFASQTLYAPPVDQWRASIGASVCTDGRPAEITGVDIDTLGDLEVAEVYLFTLTPEEIRRGGVGLFGSARGTPPGFEEPYADAGSYEGSFEDPIGRMVTTPCPDGSRSRAPTDDQQSLVVVFDVGPEGGRVGEVEVSYASLGRTREVELERDDEELDVRLCGSQERGGGCRVLSGR